jgi:GYF domain 2
MGATLYYFAVSGKTHGPLSGTEMKQAAADGLIRPGDIVWNAHGGSVKPAARSAKPALGLAPQKPRQAKRSRRNPAHDAMRMLFGG